MRKEYDITMDIFTGMEVYKGRAEKQPQLITLSDHKSGSCFESEIRFNLHTGTHVDAPKHIIDGGADISCFAPDRYHGSALVLDLVGEGLEINKEVLLRHRLEERLNQSDFILLKTLNSFEGRGGDSFAYLTADGAELISQTGVKGVGIDALGIERSQPGHPTHRRLMENDIMIIEGLDLQDVPAGQYFLRMFPLKLRGAEAAPVHARLYEIKK